MSFLVGFILGWLLCRRYTHLSIAQECERLGGFFVDSKTYTCIAIHSRNTDTSVPQAILDAQKNEVKDAT